MRLGGLELGTTTQHRTAQWVLRGLGYSNNINYQNSDILKFSPSWFIYDFDFVPSPMTFLKLCIPFLPMCKFTHCALYASLGQHTSLHKTQKKLNSKIFSLKKWGSILSLSHYECILSVAGFLLNNNARSIGTFFSLRRQKWSRMLNLSSNKEVFFPF